jgi:hypothetical protein
MTDEEWLTCPDPDSLLWFLLMNRRASDRQLRLFAVACARRVWHMLSDDRDRGLVDVAQLLADGRAPASDVRCAGSQARGPLAHLFESAASAADEGSLAIASFRAGAARRGPAFLAERSAQADLIREVFGNPNRPVVVEPDWLAWNHGFVAEMAQGIYEDRTFHRLPILCDALEDAGCTDQALLDHLRGPAPHVRGCFVLDALCRKPD